MIEVLDLNHRYGPLTAVENLSFHVQKGEVLGLLGPNGAGKSTTLRAIVGLLTPSAGRILIDGREMASEPAGARRQLGFLPEAVVLYRELRVEEMLRAISRIKGVPRAREDAEIDRVVEMFSLQSVRHRLIGFCSRGYRQRIGLAQALLGDPPVLVLDEPTVGLDPAQVVDIRQRIAELAREKAVILSTHVLSEAQALCSRVLILNRGRCVAEDRPEALEESLRGGIRLRLVVGEAPSDLAGWLQALPFVKQVVPEDQATPAGQSIPESQATPEDQAISPGNSSSGRAFQLSLTRPEAASELSAAVVRRGLALIELSPQHLGLEEVFLRLIHEEDVSS